MFASDAALQVTTDHFEYDNLESLFNNPEDNDARRISIYEPQGSNSPFNRFDHNIEISTEEIIINIPDLNANRSEIALIESMLSDNKKMDFLPIKSTYFDKFLSYIILIILLLFSAVFYITQFDIYKLMQSDIALDKKIEAIIWLMLIFGGMIIFVSSIISGFFKRRSVFIHLKSDDLPKNFFVRKKDDLIIALFSGVVGIIIGKML